MKWLFQQKALKGRLKLTKKGWTRGQIFYWLITLKTGETGSLSNCPSNCMGLIKTENSNHLLQDSDGFPTFNQPEGREDLTFHAHVCIQVNIFSINLCTLSYPF